MDNKLLIIGIMMGIVILCIGYIGDVDGTGINLASWESVGVSDDEKDNSFYTYEKIPIQFKYEGAFTTEHLRQIKIKAVIEYEVNGTQKQHVCEKKYNADTGFFYDYPVISDTMKVDIPSDIEKYDKGGNYEIKLIPYYYMLGDWEKYDDDVTHIPVEIKQIYGGFNINVDPHDSHVYIKANKTASDWYDVGTGNKTYDGLLFGGLYDIKVVHEDYVTQIKRNLKVEGGVTKNVDFNLEKGEGGLTIKPNPQSAHVYLDGVDKGSGNITFNDLEAGTQHTISVDHDDYYKKVEFVEIEKDITKEITFNLKDIPQHFVVETNILGVEIYYPYGSGIVDIHKKCRFDDIPDSGTYEFRAYKDGYKVERFDVEMDGTNKTRYIEMKKIEGKVEEDDQKHNDVSIRVFDSDENPIQPIEDADVFVNGKTKTTNDSGGVIFNITSNTIDVKVTKQDYIPYFDTYSIEDGSINISVGLTLNDSETMNETIDSVDNNNNEQLNEDRFMDLHKEQTTDKKYITVDYKQKDDPKKLIMLFGGFIILICSVLIIKNNRGG